MEGGRKMKVKTFSETVNSSFSDSYREAFKSLDRKVARLGDVKINSLVDNFYDRKSYISEGYITRVVIYESRNKGK